MNHEPRHLRARLADLAQEPVAGPDPAFVARLGARLRADAATVASHSAPTVIDFRARWLRRAARTAATAGLVTALAAAITVALLVASSRPARRAVQLAGATDTQVIQPDGSVRTATAGAGVPDGALVRTGPGGSTAAGGVNLGPNSAAIVVDGQLHTVTSAASDHKTSPSAGDEAAAGRAHALHLTVRRDAGSAVTLRWNRLAGAGVYGYVVLRTGNGAAAGAAIDMARDSVAFTTGTTLTDRAAGSGPLVYRVVAVDRQGRIVAESQAVAATS